MRLIIIIIIIIGMAAPPFQLLAIRGRGRSILVPHLFQPLVRISRLIDHLGLPHGGSPGVVRTGGGMRPEGGFGRGVYLTVGVLEHEMIGEVPRQGYGPLGVVGVQVHGVGHRPLVGDGVVVGVGDVPMPMERRDHQRIDVALQFQKLAHHPPLKRLDLSHRIDPLEPGVIPHVSIGPEQRRLIQSHVMPRRRGTGEGRHPPRERHVRGIRRGVRAVPQYPPRRVGEVRSRLRDVRIGRPVQSDGPLPVPHYSRGGIIPGDVIGRFPGSSRQKIEFGG
mmetsp:Transcript_6626/g.19561  ORF Transcript_6626/g.19561 Transcript_6626/m.19561 type:complete len:278 (+) Transcript_6626:618-1451(+)